ncbi:SPT3 Dosage dependent suppressor of Ty-induced promoter mutations-like protein [Entomortierella chlamydospora]|uniref:SPT3 Dosage dependent suppressor of Ty-induced promoter mutations-like protein n=1 Tax=Entomortierella chlamydospora TaxID=101097 RepID=A0A9P6MQT1_9FUNG|nr:SPT3 Dosage dependent suppressor of Ty-induced promoter mutations-like protein [Entomortierella chlamydospora]
MAGYTLEARIIQKKDQIEEVTPSGEVIPAPVVEEIRTGQQFLIKLQFLKQGMPAQSSSKFPTMRVDRRVAINTAGEPRSDVEPLTLEIIVHLAKSGQVRKAACAKCCHKYGPSSPILVLLDPLSPSVTDPSSYSHIDTSTGSITILAKVVCSSTDHGERGNKDRYQFEFRLKRTSSMMVGTSRVNVNPMGADSKEDIGDTIANCYTVPIMCSGHHKAKRVYPSQRPSTVKKEGPTPKIKVIKHRKSIPNVEGSIQSSQMFNATQEELLRAGSSPGSSSYPSPLSFMQDNAANASVMSNFIDEQPGDFDFGSNLISNQQQLLAPSDISSDSSLQQQSQPQLPKISEVRPDHGPIRKAIDVIIRGLSFREGMVPFFGGYQAQDVVIETSKLIICKAPESPLPGTVPITIYDSNGAIFSDLGQFTYTEDTETELLMLQLQLQLAHRAIEILRNQATGLGGNANEILKELPGLPSTANKYGGSSLGNGARMMMGSDESIENTPKMTLAQVEECVLRTIEQLPREVDISMQLNDQGNLLHFSVLLKLDKLTRKLIESGCELDALDAWGMTPLMYAVIKENEPIVQALVLAGASSSGAKTPDEFYTFLPRPVKPTVAVIGYLSVCCTRYSNTSRRLTRVGDNNGQEMVHIEHDETSESSADEDLDMEDVAKHNAPATSQVADQNPFAATTTTTTAIGERATAEPAASSAPELTSLEKNIRGVHLVQDISPLHQQGLPLLQGFGFDSSATTDNRVLRGDDIQKGVPGATVTTQNEESGYHSGVYSEVQERLNRLADLPSEGLKLLVALKADTLSASPSPAPISTHIATATPITSSNLFRTGSDFNIEIRLATISENPSIPLPREHLGIRFPHEMVKRAPGMPPPILNEMTYILKTTIELGRSARQYGKHDQTNEAHNGYGDGISLKSSCKNCSEYLHKTKPLPPSRVLAENPTGYPILQLSVPVPATVSGASTPGSVESSNNANSNHNAGVVELKDGKLSVRARVNCSSLHSLRQREFTRRMALRDQQQRQQQSEEGSSSSSSAPKKPTPIDLSDLLDPGYVFIFELVHPNLNTVVAKYETTPIYFQTYSLGKN